jgi:hypothetical protein
MQLEEAYPNRNDKSTVCSNWWFENTLSFTSEETSLDSVLPSYLPLGDIPCPSSPPYGFLHHSIETSETATRLLLSQIGRYSLE